MTNGCDHKLIDSNVCLKCGWSPPIRKRKPLVRLEEEDDDGTPPGVVVGELTQEQRARMREALLKLHTPKGPGEPEDPDALSLIRLEALRRDYPDVAELIGCQDVTSAQ